MNHIMTFKSSWLFIATSLNSNCPFALDYLPGAAVYRFNRKTALAVPQTFLKAALPCAQSLHLLSASHFLTRVGATYEVKLEVKGDICLSD